MIFIMGCNVTKKLPPNEYLLIKNKFKINTPKIESDALSGYLQQTPNTRLFGMFRANIAFYNWGSSGKDSKFKKWLRTKVGTAPVLLDTSMISISLKQMRLYLNNKGYFGSKLYDSVIYKKRKAEIVYYIVASVPYTFNCITYLISDSVLAGYVYMDTAKCLIKKGQNYDSYLLDNERSRITNKLMDHGFFKFSNTYITFRIDSALNKRKVDLTIEITNPVMPSLLNFGTLVETHHKRYFINKIFIYPQFSLLQADSIHYDTLVKTYKGYRHDTTLSTYSFLHAEKMKIRPGTIAQSIFVKNGVNYNLSDVSQTYSQLSSLNVFKYINIQFQESTETGKENQNLLDCKIQLAQSSVNSFSVSPDITNSAGAPGLQGNITYGNKNIFNGAQFLKLGFNASAQAQGSINSSSNSVFFNTIEFGVNASLTFPQFLIPIKQEKLPKTFKPRTTINIGYDFQQQPDYNRHISNITFGYTWNQNEQIRHVLNPAEILFVKAILDSSFSASLDNMTDKRYKNQYSNHIVAGLKYSLTFNNQVVNKIQDFIYLRSNFETGGNLLYVLDAIFNGPKNSNGNYTLFNIAYAQYIRPDLDIRFYHLLSRTQSLVLRFYGGIGIPYGNANVLPFEKAFFAGGANDLRGWKLGTLGPGSYHNDTVTSYDQSGDIQLQANFEYRFPVYKWFKTAFFVDAGNIWLRQEAADFPGGKFTWGSVINEVAIDAGIGLRFDFDYFIFRLDPAIPVRVPYYPKNDRWYVGKLQISDIIWNFGIGYPF